MNGTGRSSLSITRSPIWISFGIAILAKDSFLNLRPEPPVLGDELDAGGVGKLHRVLVGEDLLGLSPTAFFTCDDRLGDRGRGSHDGSNGGGSGNGGGGPPRRVPRTT
jgi:hypothetical protein